MLLKKWTIYFLLSSDKKSLSDTFNNLRRFETKPAFSAAISTVQEVLSTNYSSKVKINLL